MTRFLTKVHKHCLMSRNLKPFTWMNSFLNYFWSMDMQVLQGLEVATNCIEDMDEWLGIFNVKLRHMREDIQSVC